MKKFLIIFLVLSGPLSAQVGPGVGTSLNNELWLDANSLSLTNGDPLSSWTDISGNDNHAIQLTSSNQPIFESNLLNGLPGIQFDGTNDYLDLTDNITSEAVTVFIVFNETASRSWHGLLSLEKYLFLARQYNSFNVDTRFGSVLTQKIYKPSSGFSIFSANTGATASSNLGLTSGTNVANFSRSSFYSNPKSAIGFRANGSVYFTAGEIAEIIVYNEKLDSASRNIVLQYLGSKYDLTVPNSGIYSYRSTHGIDVKGIGQESDGSNSSARGRDSLLISNPSSLGNGDYILVGNDGAGYGTSSDAGILADNRWTQVWRSDVTGTPGTVDLTFYLGSNDFASDANNYGVLIENVDGDFTNGGTALQESGRVYDGANKTVTFTGITLADGDYFTLAEKTADNTFNINYGPGGIGSTSTIATWLDASKLNFSNNDPVDVWSDQSGNNNLASQVTASNMPLFKLNQLNSKPALEFDGVNDFLSLPDINTGEITIFIISKEDAAKDNALLTTNNHLLVARTQFNSLNAYYIGSSHTISVAKPNAYGIHSLQTDGTSGPTNVTLRHGSSSSTKSRNGFSSFGGSTIGVRITGYAYYLDGYIPEIIIYNEQINSAKRKIVGNYLAAKYNLTAEQNLYAYKSGHGNDVIGIGQESDGSHVDSRGTYDSLKISNPSALGNGDYILVGNDGGAFTAISSGSSLATNQWTKIWRSDVTGTPGTIDLTFYLGSNDFAVDPNDYIVLIENDDGDFSNGGASLQESGRVYDAVNKTVSFTGITLADGDYFTLAEKDENPTAIANGLWSNSSTWSCACIPTSSLDVTIASPFEVTISSSSLAKSVTIDVGGTLTFSGSDTLTINEGLVINGEINEGTGTINADGSSAQTFTNSSGTLVSLNNLEVNNTTSLLLGTGGWAISGNLQVNSGNLDVSSADSVVLVSNATQTAQILQSIDGAFVGEFTTQRYISARNANFGLLSSPISGATVESLDDDLFISGVLGRSGNASNSSGGVFYTMFGFDRSNNNKRDTLQSTGTALNIGEGYEVYLASTFSTFNATTVDFHGTPNDGNIVPRSINQGWNLIGNPYQSFIAFDNLDKTNITNSFYLFDTQAGSYSLKGSGDNIAPAQGFWIFKSTAGSVAFNFEESDKVSSNSSSFVRKKRNNDFLIEVKNNTNSYSHKAMLGFNFDASNAIDEFDARYLPSPLKEAPAIYFSLNNDFDHLVRNTLNSNKEDFYNFKLSLEIGESGPHSLSFSNAPQLTKDFTCVKLIDKKLKKIIDIDNQTTYAFEAEVGKIDRFEIILSNSWDECEEDELLANKSISSSKAFELENRNGEWYLNFNLEGKDQVNIAIYSLNGQLVKPINSITIENKGRVKIDNFVGLKGIYMLQVKGSKDQTNRTINL